MRKGVVLSIDVMVSAGMLITLSMFIASMSFTSTSAELRYQKMYYAGKDLMNVIYDVSFGSVNSSFEQSLLNDGLIESDDLNKTLLEVIGSLWATDNTTHRDYARNITQEIFDEILSDKYGYELLINNQSIYRKNDTYIKYVSRSNVLVSGYDVGKPTTGYAARAYLGQIERKINDKIFAMNIGGVGYSHGDYWQHGYAPPDSVYNGPGERGQTIDTMKFYLSNDSIVHQATLTKSVCGATARHELGVNGEWSSGILGDQIADYNITDYVHAEWNNLTLFMTDYDNSSNNYIFRDMAHNHPGNFINVQYETKELGQSQTGTKRFHADSDMGTPATYENIPFYVPGDNLTSVTARVNVKGLNMVAYMALNYKFNASNPSQGEILNKAYADTSDKDVTFDINFTSTGIEIRECVRPSNITVIFNETFDTDEGGFNYLDDLYQGTSQPSEVDGSWVSDPECAGGGCLHVDLNTDPDSSGPWSGGWNGSFTVTDNATQIRITFYWYDYITPEAESGERVRIYARDVSDSSEILVDETHGDDNTDSGTFSYTVTIPDGTYDFDFGCWQSDVSTSNEQAECWIDDVVVEAIYPSTSETCTDLPVNTNITLSDIYTDRTNVLGLYFDTRQPRRYDPAEPLHPDNHADGCDSACTSDLTATETDHYTYLAPAAYASEYATGRCEIYSDIENDEENSTYIEVNYTGGKELEYGYVTITKTYPFTSVLGDDRPGTDYRAGTEAAFFVLDFEVVEVRLLGVQGPWGGRDNGYNFVFIQPEGGTENLVLDTNHPPGTITYIPAEYFQRGATNYVRVYDVQSGRELDITRSYVELTYMIKMSVSYGNVFPKAEGSQKQVYYDYNQDGNQDGNVIVTIGNPSDPFDPVNDSIDDAFARLLDELNFYDDQNPNAYGNGTLADPYDGINSTNPIDLEITPDIAIVTGYTGDVPSLWGPAIMEIRIWN